MLKNKSASGSDHSIHVSVIDRIKANNHRFLTDYIFSINEKHIWYPQLLHWLLSFFPQKIYKENHDKINIVIKLIEVVSFNLFLYFLYQRTPFDEIVFLYANIVMNVVPFNYAVWNAKNTGLSARGVGLVAGHIYTYLIVAYAYTNSLLLLFFLLITILIIILLSQMTIQYLVFSIPLFVYFFKIPEIIVLPFIAMGVFYVMMPKVALNFIYGQYNYKRNYGKFIAEIFILRKRPSIYRDFIYDFWVNLRKKTKSGLTYIYFNPIVEIIYGIPFLWFVIYFSFNNQLPPDDLILFQVILTCLLLFLATSFKWTRFLGEPQRYIEYSFPLISVLYVGNFDLFNQLILILFCVCMIALNYFLLAPSPSKMKSINGSRDKLINYLASDSKFENSVCVSNDLDFLKFLAQLNIKIVRPDIGCYYKNKKHFHMYFNSNFRELSAFAIKEYISLYKPNYLVVNKKYYDFDTLDFEVKSKVKSKLFEVDEFSLFELV